MVDQAFSLNGVDGFVRVPSSASLTPSGSFSIDAWIYPTTDADGTILSIWGDTGEWVDQRSYQLVMLSGRRLRFAISGDATQHNAALHVFDTSTAVLTLNTWNHVAATYSQSSGTRRIYVNGVQVADRTDSPITVTSSIAAATIGATLRSPNIFLGSFSGLIDEVELFNRALSVNEIQAIFDAGSAGKCKVINVGIDIKPGSFPNSINLGSGGATPVAILGSATLNVLDIDETTLTLGTAGIKTVGKKAPHLLCSIEDMSGDFSVGLEGIPDGFLDLLCHFVTVAIVPEAGDTDAKLSGNLLDGTPIEGSDSVNIVP